MAVSINPVRLEAQIALAVSEGLVDGGSSGFGAILGANERLRSVRHFGDEDDAGEVFPELLVVPDQRPISEKVGRVVIGGKPLVTFLSDKDITVVSDLAIPTGVNAYPIFNVTIRRFMRQADLLLALKIQRGLTVDEWFSLAFQFPQTGERIPAPLLSSATGVETTAIVSIEPNSGKPTLGCRIRSGFSSDWFVPLCDRG